MNVYDDRITPEIACASVAGVEAAYLANGERVPVEDVLDGLSVERGSPPGTLGQYHWGWRVRDEILLSDVLDNDRELRNTLTHEIIHAVQDRYEGVEYEEMQLHTCPWYGYESGEKCMGLRLNTAYATYARLYAQGLLPVEEMRLSTLR